MWLDWTPVTNVEAACAGQRSCVERIPWRGVTLCRLVTEPGRVNALTLGRLLRECADANDPTLSQGLARPQHGH